jgi:hypothetical protein
MANAIYPKFKEAAFKGAANVDLTGGTISGRRGLRFTSAVH